MIIPPPPVLTDLRAGTQLVAGMTVSTVLPDLDFETYSEAGFVPLGDKWGALPRASQGKKGLPVVGAARYAEHPTTEVLCLAYNLKDGIGPRQWLPGMPPPLDLFLHIAKGGLLEAWNVGFERHIWEKVCVPRMGWIAVPRSQWRCAMAKSRAHALPGALDNATRVLNTTHQKNPDGRRLLNRFSVPRNATRSDPRLRIQPGTDPEGSRLYEYNRQDIEAEAEASSLTPDLPPEELEYWLVDQEINQRGVHIDMVGVTDCISIVEEALERYNTELAQLTSGVVNAASEIQRLTGWLGALGVHMQSLDEENVTEALKRTDLPPIARRALEIRALVGSASVKKLFSMSNQVCADGRLRDLFSYHAARTGRATGNGPQPTNLPNSGPDVNRCNLCQRHFGRLKPTCPWCGSVNTSPVEWNALVVEDALDVMKAGSLRAAEMFFDDAFPAISGCLRGLFDAAPGYDLICSDYSAIEAVVLAELAGESWRQEVFRTHGKIYEMSAAKITGIPFEAFERHRKETGQHLSERKLGKVAELSGGFGGWLGAWKAFGADSFMSDEEIIRAILAWRAASPSIVEFWGGQQRNWQSELYGLEGAALTAIYNPGQEFTHRGITFVMRGDALYCRLLSGRYLTYHRPRLAPSERRADTVEITYEGWNSNPKNGPMGWIRMKTYGGRLTENCIAEGTQVLTDSGWRPIESVTENDLVHDGIEFVSCGGMICKSVQGCIQVDDVWMTPDHQVLTEEGWVHAASERCRPYRPEIRDADSYLKGENGWQKTHVVLPLRLRQDQRKGALGSDSGAENRSSLELWLQDKGNPGSEAYDTRNDKPPRVLGVALHERQVPSSLPPSLEKLRGSWDLGVRRVANVIRSLLERHGRVLLPGPRVGPREQQRELREVKLPLGNRPNAIEQQKTEYLPGYAAGAYDGRSSVPSIQNRGDDPALPERARVAAGTDVCGSGLQQSRRRVYDILNAGPRHRFVVRGSRGPFIVHNCVQATARDIQRHSLVAQEKAGYPIVLHCYDENVAEIPEGWGSIEEFEAIMMQMPAWAQNWPIRAAGGWRGKRYRKD